METQQQNQQLPQLSPSILSSTEHSRNVQVLQKETSAPTIYNSNTLESYTGRSEPLVENNTRLLNILADDDDELSSTSGSIDSTTDSSTQTAAVATALSSSGLARKWLDSNAHLEDGGSAARTLIDLNSPNSKSVTLKIRRHTDNYLNPGDWWTKLATKQPVAKTFMQTESKGSSGPNRIPTINDLEKSYKRHSSNNHEQPSSNKGTKRMVVPQVAVTTSAPKRTVYREQPLNQNSILTIRYQLGAIKKQHKTLVTRSMAQLQQLDNKLVDSYKLCFKKKMPLYAGMLYRTRDFVVKLAKDVNHEKRVLEAMVKQVEKVLRQKMTNQTLVKEYNQLVAASTEHDRSVQQPTTESTEFQGQSKFRVNSKRESGQEIQVPEIDGASDTSFNKGSHLQNSNNIAAPKSNPISSTTTTTTTNSTTVATSISDDNVKTMQLEGQEREAQIAAKKTKPTKYVVSVNEVNLKKELNKIQALIDRVNGSTFELTSVVEDINYLFKLTADHGNRKFFNTKMTKLNKFYGTQQQDMAGGQFISEQQRRGKKPLKSPIRVFFERYGKLTMSSPEETLNSNLMMPGNNNTDTNSNAPMDPPEMKPLFEPSSLSYSDPTSNKDLGFNEANTTKDGE